MDNSSRNHSMMENRTFHLGHCEAYSPPGVITTSYVLLMLLSFVGNVTVIDIVRRNQKLPSMVNMLVVNMCVSDLVTTLITIPYRLRQFYVGFLWFDGLPGTVLCKLEEFAVTSSNAVSILTMTAMAIERFHCVCRATKSTYIWSKIRRMLIVIIWCIAVILCSTSFDSRRVLQKTDIRFYCIYTWRPKQWKIYYFALIMVLVVLPLFVISVLYTAVIISLRRQNARIANLLTFQALRRRVKQNRKIIFMLLAIVAVNATAYIPLSVNYIYYLLEVQNIFKYCNVQFFTFFLFCIPSALNPAVCFAFNDKYGQKLRQFLQLMSTCLPCRVYIKGPIDQPHSNACAVVQAGNNEAVQMKETGQAR